MTLRRLPLRVPPGRRQPAQRRPRQEEVARSLGVGRVRTFWRVTVGQARLAILGGSLLVALVLLAEYGAFEILGYRTFTTEIYTEYLNGFDPPAASALSLVLVALSLLLLFGEGASRGGGRVARTSSMASRPPFRHRLGSATWPALAGCVRAGRLGARRAHRRHRLLAVPRAGGGRRVVFAGLGRVAHRRSTARRPGCWRRCWRCRSPSCRSATAAAWRACSSAAPTSCSASRAS